MIRAQVTSREVECACVKSVLSLVHSLVLAHSRTPVAEQVLRELQEKEKASMHRLEGCTWHPEYGSWMVEATPRQPFSGYAADLVRVRRIALRRVLLPSAKRVPSRTTCSALWRLIP